MRSQDSAFLRSSLAIWVASLLCRGGWQIAGTPLELHDPRLLAIREAERQLLEAEYEDYNATNASGVAFCRSAALLVSIYWYLSQKKSKILSRFFGIDFIET